MPSNMDIILTKQTLILHIPYDQSKYSVLLSTHPVLVNKRLRGRLTFGLKPAVQVKLEQGVLQTADLCIGLG